MSIPRYIQEASPRTDVHSQICPGPASEGLMNGLYKLRKYIPKPTKKLSIFHILFSVKIGLPVLVFIYSSVWLFTLYNNHTNILFYRDKTPKYNDVIRLVNKINCLPLDLMNLFHENKDISFQFVHLSKGGIFIPQIQTETFGKNH